MNSHPAPIWVRQMQVDRSYMQAGPQHVEPAPLSVIYSRANRSMHTKAAILHHTIRKSSQGSDEDSGFEINDLHFDNEIVFINRYGKGLYGKWAFNQFFTRRYCDGETFDQSTLRITP